MRESWWPESRLEDIEGAHERYTVQHKDVIR